MDEEREHPGECDCCGYETQDLILFKDMATTIGAGIGKGARLASFYFCGLCSSTVAGVSYRYPGQHGDDGAMRTICYVANVLLSELKKLTRGISE